MLTLAAGPDGVVRKGEETFVTEEQAEVMEASGHAERVKTKRPKTIMIQTASSPPAENATTRTGDHDRLPDEPKHLGGGKYLLPNGEEVTGGKDAALARWEELQGEQRGEDDEVIEESE